MLSEQAGSVRASHGRHCVKLMLTVRDAAGVCRSMRGTPSSSAAVAPHPLRRRKMSFPMASGAWSILRYRVGNAYRQ